MGADMFHLAWFYEGASPQAWGRPFTGAIGRDWMKPDFSLDVARILERRRLFRARAGRWLRGMGTEE